MPPETTITVIHDEAKLSYSAKPQNNEASRSKVVFTSNPEGDEVLKVGRAQAKSKSTASAAKTVSNDATGRKRSAVEQQDATVNDAGMAKTSGMADAELSDISNMRAANPREKRAKEIVAKENSAKTTNIGSADEAPALGEARIVKSAAGVKTSAAAFFAARQRMAPGKPLAKTVPVKTRETEQRQPTGGQHADGLPVAPKAAADVIDQKAIVPSVERTAAEVAPTTNEGPRPAHPFDKAPIAKGPVKAPTAKGQGFKTGEFIVYPAHGVGQITAIEEQEVAGYKLELFVIGFVKDKMILKVPLPKIVSVGMRKLAEPPVVKRALDTLTGRARIKRTMWSRRAQEYEAKINSGDLVAIAEVVRDLYRSDAQPEQSYSERQLYEAALDRMAREIAVVQKLSDSEALKLIDDQLQKGPRRSKVEETEAEDSDEPDENGIVEAA